MPAACSKVFQLPVLLLIKVTAKQCDCFCSLTRLSTLPQQVLWGLSITSTHINENFSQVHSYPKRPIEQKDFLFPTFDWKALLEIVIDLRKVRVSGYCNIRNISLFCLIAQTTRIKWLGKRETILITNKTTVERFLKAVCICPQTMKFALLLLSFSSDLIFVPSLQ